MSTCRVLNLSDSPGRTQICWECPLRKYHVTLFDSLSSWDLDDWLSGIWTRRYQDIWVSRFGGLWRCSSFSGNCCTENTDICMIVELTLQHTATYCNTKSRDTCHTDICMIVALQPYDCRTNSWVPVLREIAGNKSNFTHASESVLVLRMSLTLSNANEIASWLPVCSHRLILKSNIIRECVYSITWYSHIV